MARVLLSAVVASLFSSTLAADYFFLPPRDLYNRRPDYYVLQQLSYGFYPPPFASYPRHFPGFIGGQGRGTYQVVVSVPPRGGEVIRANYADLVFRINPSRALVYVDGKLIGNARDFSTERDRYTILEGTHQLRIEFPGYLPFETEMEITPNRTLHLDIELQPLPAGD